MLCQSTLQKDARAAVSVVAAAKGIPEVLKSAGESITNAVGALASIAAAKVTVGGAPLEAGVRQAVNDWLRKQLLKLASVSEECPLTN